MDNDETKKDASIDIDEALKAIKSILDDPSRLKTTQELMDSRREVKFLKETMTNQQAELESFRKTFLGYPIQIITDNNTIISNIVDLIKSSEKCILLITPKIFTTDLNDALSNVFQQIKEKALNKKVKTIYVRYRERDDGTGQGQTTKQDVSKMLGDSTILDIEPDENLHARLIMNEKKCLILSHNFIPQSFEDDTKEIAVLIDGEVNAILFDDLKQQIRKNLGVSI